MATRSRKLKKISSSNDSETGNQLGEFLAAARKSKDMTLADVAERLGLRSGQSVWDWENGKGSGIPADTLLKLVKLYGVSVDQAYDLLLQFHEAKVRRKIMAKFQLAYIKVFGRKARTDSSKKL